MQGLISEMSNTESQYDAIILYVCLVFYWAVMLQDGFVNMPNQMGFSIYSTVYVKSVLYYLLLVMLLSFHLQVKDTFLFSYCY